VHDEAGLKSGEIFLEELSPDSYPSVALTWMEFAPKMVAHGECIPAKLSARFAE